MNEKIRNMAVGITVLAALCLLAGLILILMGLPRQLNPGYELQLLTDGANEVRKGDPVQLVGIQIGRVTDIGFTGGDPRKGVTITALIDADVRLPGNVKAYIFKGSSFQGARIVLRPEGAYLTDPRTGAPLEYLPTQPPIVMAAMVETSGLIPPEFLDAVKSLRKLADNLTELVSPTAQAPAPGTGQAASAPSEEGIKGAVAKINRSLDAFNTVFGDPQNQDNIKKALNGISKSATAFEELAVTSRVNLDAISDKLVDTSEQISRLTMSLNKIAQKIDAGDGTAGKLLNDPALYNGLVDMAKALDKLSQDVSTLVKKWDEQGIQLKTR